MAAEHEGITPGVPHSAPRSKTHCPIWPQTLRRQAEHREGQAQLRRIATVDRGDRLEAVGRPAAVRFRPLPDAARARAPRAAEPTATTTASKRSPASSKSSVNARNALDARRPGGFRRPVRGDEAGGSGRKHLVEVGCRQQQVGGAAATTEVSRSVFTKICADACSGEVLSAARQSDFPQVAAQRAVLAMAIEQRAHRAVGVEAVADPCRKRMKRTAADLLGQADAAGAEQACRQVPGRRQPGQAQPEVAVRLAAGEIQFERQAPEQSRRGRRRPAFIRRSVSR
jgi:hypothetical protein